MDTRKFLRRIIRIVFISFCFSLPINVASAGAVSVTLRWDANTPTPDGYRVFVRQVDQAYDYSQPSWEGSKTTCTIDDLESQIESCFVVRAYDDSLESADSKEVSFVPSDETDSVGDTTHPSWDGATTGIGLLTDDGTGGSVTLEFDAATDTVDGSNLNFNIYYAASQYWDDTDWTQNNVIVHASVTSGSTFTYAASVTGLTNGVSYTFGVRVEDQTGNEDSNANTMIVTPSLTQDSSGTSDTQPLSLASNFAKTVLTEGNAYYTDRDYTLTSVPSAYLNLNAILLPNDEGGKTVSSGYLTFVMPENGTVYVAYDSRATSLPDWLLDFSDTGERIYTSLSTQPYLAVYQNWYASGETVDLGGNKADGFSGGTVSNYLVFYDFGEDADSASSDSSSTSDSDTQTISVASKFTQTVLTEVMAYYTDRDYTLTSVPSAYLNLNAILLPNDERGKTVSSGYLTFVMPGNGTVYVAYDSRATSLPDWLLDFSDTGERIYTSLSTQPYLAVYQNWYAPGETVDLGGNQASGFTGDTVSNYLVFY